MVKRNFSRIVPAAVSAVVLSVALLPSLSSCSGGGDASVCRSADDSDMSFRRLSAKQYYTLANTAKDYDSDKDLLLEAGCDLLMPESVYGKDISALRDSITRVAFDTVCATPAKSMEAFMAGSAGLLGFDGSAKATSAGKDVTADGNVMVTGSVLNLDAGMMSYLVGKYYYAPRAAHGMSVSLYVNYDAEGNKVFTVADLFTPEGLAKLPELIKKEAASLLPLTGPTEVTALPAGGNFYISQRKEIVFAYQPYEIASYAQGQIDIPMEPYVLSEYLTPYGKKLLLTPDAD